MIPFLDSIRFSFCEQVLTVVRSKEQGQEKNNHFFYPGSRFENSTELEMMKLIRSYSPLKDVLLVCSIWLLICACGVCVRKQPQPSYSAPSSDVCIVLPDNGVLELKAFFTLMLLYPSILGWAAHSVSPQPAPQPAQKPDSLNVNANKTPVKGDTLHVLSWCPTDVSIQSFSQQNLLPIQLSMLW